MLRPLSVFLLLSLAMGGLFASRSHRVALVCGPAVENRQQLDKARKGLYRSLRERTDWGQIIFMGDMVSDNASLLAPTAQTLDSISVPWFCVPGDKDRDFYRPATSTRPGGNLPSRDRDFATWRTVMPAMDSSWIAFEIRWIILNNIRTTGNKYVGGLNEGQKAWLENILKNAPQQQRVVLCTHLPLSQCAGADSLQRILSLHKDTRQICAAPCSDPEVLSVSDQGGLYILDIKNGSW